MHRWKAVKQLLWNPTRCRASLVPIDFHISLEMVIIGVGTPFENYRIRVSTHMKERPRPGREVGNRERWREGNWARKGSGLLTLSTEKRQDTFPWVFPQFYGKNNISFPKKANKNNQSCSASYLFDSLLWRGKKKSPGGLELCSLSWGFQIHLLPALVSSHRIVGCLPKDAWSR